MSIDRRFDLHSWIRFVVRIELRATKKFRTCDVSCDVFIRKSVSVRKSAESEKNRSKENTCNKIVNQWVSLTWNISKCRQASLQHDAHHHESMEDEFHYDISIFRCLLISLFTLASISIFPIVIQSTAQRWLKWRWDFFHCIQLLSHCWCFYSTLN